MSVFSVSFLIAQSHLKCSVCPEVFLPMLGCWFSGFKAASLQAGGYDATSRSLSAYFCSASYFPLLQPYVRIVQMFLFPNVKSWSMIYVWHPYSPCTQKIFPLVFSSFLAKGDKQHNSIKYLSPLPQCLHVFYPFPFLLPLEIFAIVFLLFIPRVTSIGGLNICLFLFVLPVQIGFLCFWWLENVANACLLWFLVLLLYQWYYFPYWQLH